MDNSSHAAASRNWGDVIVEFLWSANPRDWFGTAANNSQSHTNAHQFSRPVVAERQNPASQRRDARAGPLTANHELLERETRQRRSRHGPSATETARSRTTFRRPDSRERSPP